MCEYSYSIVITTILYKVVVCHYVVNLYMYIAKELEFFSQNTESDIIITIHTAILGRQLL